MKSTKHWLAACACLAALLGAGCTSVNPINAEQWAKAYYGQPNSTPLVTLKGEKMRITLENVNELAVSTQLPAKNMIPKDPGTTETIMDAIKTIAPWAAVGYMWSSSDLGTAKHVTNNYAAPPAAAP